MIALQNARAAAVGDVAGGHVIAFYESGRVLYGLTVQDSNAGEGQQASLLIVSATDKAQGPTLIDHKTAVRRPCVDLGAAVPQWDPIDAILYDDSYGPGSLLLTNQGAAIAGLSTQNLGAWLLADGRSPDQIRSAFYLNKWQLCIAGPAGERTSLVQFG